MEKVTQKKDTVSCGACVYRIKDDDIQILLVKPHQGRDSWGVPKGHIDEGETHEQCAIREVKEETGIDVVLEEELPVVWAIFKSEKKKVVTFLARQLCSSNPFPNDGENIEVTWHSVLSLPALHFYQKPMISSAVEKLKSKYGK